MELFNDILFWVNNVLVTIVGIAFTSQLIYILFFFLKAKKYPAAKKQHRFGIVIPARNEKDVIGDTVKCILSQNYPRELFDVFVIADNCTDNTAQLARDAGAIVYERFDSDPKHHNAGYALKFLFEQILQNHDVYDAYIKFDADNLMNTDFIARMNDAFDAGVKSARCYANSKNLTQTTVSGISGLWYIRDCRFACQVRSFLNTTQMLGGAGMMFSAEIIHKYNGWDCLTNSDDAEFAMKRLNQDKIYTKYVKEAVVYEDQPSTIKETYNRYLRMGRPLFKMFFTQGIKSFLNFFRRPNWSYIDMFLNLLFVPIAVLCCIWLPLYYGYDIIYKYCTGSIALANEALILIAILLVCAFIIPFILQAILAYFLDRKKLIIEKKSVIVKSILFFPAFMIIYAIAITLGVFKRPKWRAVKRNVVAVNIQSPKAEAAANTDIIEPQAQQEDTEPQTEISEPDEQLQENE